MNKLPIPDNEQERLLRLRNYQILDSDPEQQFDDLTLLASKICETPICLITMLDEERNWLKSTQGVGDLTESPREISFCQYAIMDSDIFMVSDLLNDERFKNNPLVTDDPNIRFYAGAPIIDEDGFTLGTICVFDQKPNHLNQFQQDALKVLASTAMQLIKYRAVIIEKNKYVKFFDDSTDMFGIADENGKLQEINDAFEQKLEYSKKEILHMPFSTHVHELDIELCNEAIINAVKNQNFKETLFRIKSKSGNQLWIYWKASFDKDLKQYYIIGRDVTEGIENLRKLENELQAINNAVIRAELSPDGKILKLNQSLADLLELESKDLINKKHSELLFDENKDNSEHEELFNELRKGNVQKGIFRRKGRNDKEIWVKGSYMPVISDSGEIEKIIKIAYDISDTIELENSLKKAVEIAAKASKSKDIFLANISHDIRTPLNAISGFSHLLSEQELNTENNSYVEAISLASKSLLLLINDVLDISKFESDIIELENKPFDLPELIEDLIKVSTTSIKAKNLKFITTVDRDMPKWVMGDPARLIQILSNLIGNATKFTSQGFLKLETNVTNVTKDNVNITFVIEDSGIGIEKDKLESVFERFSQENESSEREFSGSGLGLSIVKMLVDLYHGEIQVTSEKGIGSKFTFSCAFKLHSKDFKEETKPTRKQKNALEGIQVLIAEDNEHNQILAKAFISKNKGIPTVVENGLEACQLLKNEIFDCVLMDLQMPIRNGFESSVYIRNELKLDIPIIACTAHSLVGEKKKAYESGMNDYVTKPFTENEIVNAILKNCKIIGNAEIQETQKITKAGVSEVFNTFEKEEGKEFLIQMLTIFKRRIPQDVIEIKDALVQKDLKTIQYKAHLIAGSLSSFMLNKGTTYAKELEKHAIDKDLTNVNISARKLLLFLQDVLDYISENYEIK